MSKMFHRIRSFVAINKAANALHCGDYTYLI